MLEIHDTLAGDDLTFYYVQSKQDCSTAMRWIRSLPRKVLALDTESTGFNPYRPQWKLRTFQFGHATESFVVPARLQGFIQYVLGQDIKWIGHNGPHDIRCLDVYLGFRTGIVCAETYLPAHHLDSRNASEGGVNHGLKDQACAHIDPESGKWEIALKQAFKAINIPMIGEVYKSGTRKGTQKFRKAKLSEGWSLIDPEHPAYIAYAAADPILTYRIWRYYRGTLVQFRDLYAFDHEVQDACDRLTRRAIRLDTDYTERLSAALTDAASYNIDRARELGCSNIYSGPQIAAALLKLGAELTERTPKGAYKTDDKVLRSVASNPATSVRARQLIRSILRAKRCTKRREAYADAMLREVDAQGRVHPSINSLGARTARMSVSNPALQQLPTREEE